MGYLSLVHSSYAMVWCAILGHGVHERSIPEEMGKPEKFVSAYYKGDVHIIKVQTILVTQTKEPLTDFENNRK